MDKNNNYNIFSINQEDNYNMSIFQYKIDFKNYTIDDKKIFPFGNFHDLQIYFDGISCELMFWSNYTNNRLLICFGIWDKLFYFIFDPETHLIKQKSCNKGIYNDGYFIKSKVSSNRQISLICNLIDSSHFQCFLYDSKNDIWSRNIEFDTIYNHKLYNENEVFLSNGVNYNNYNKEYFIYYLTKDYYKFNNI